jgi:hypothetical protein
MKPNKLKIILKLKVDRKQIKMNKVCMVQTRVRTHKTLQLLRQKKNVCVENRMKTCSQ